LLDKNFSLALVAPSPPPAGGMANQAQLLFDYLIEDGKEVYFIRTNESYRPAWIAKVKIIRSLFRLNLYLYSIWQMAGKVKLFHVLSNSGWSWFLFSAPVLLIAKIKGVPVVINYRGGEADAFFKRSWKWIYPSLKTASDVIVPTAFLQSVFQHWDIKTNIVPNLIDLDLFRPNINKKSEQKLHFIVTRNLEKIYGNEIVIKSFQIILNQYPNAKLTVAGSGPEKKNLEQLVKTCHIESKVTFTGKLERKEIAQLYQSADIMLNASTIDNTPNSIIEALACGVTVISSSAGGIPWLVKHEETAMLMKKNTPEAMSKLVDTVLNQPALKDKLRVNGLQLAERFTWLNVKEKLYQSYESILSESRA